VSSGRILNVGNFWGKRLAQSNVCPRASTSVRASYYYHYFIPIILILIIIVIIISIAF
jgi:hypothetical protein